MLFILVHRCASYEVIFRSAPLFYVALGWYWWNGRSTSLKTQLTAWKPHFAHNLRSSGMSHYFSGWSWPRRWLLLFYFSFSVSANKQNYIPSLLWLSSKSWIAEKAFARQRPFKWVLNSLYFNHTEFAGQIYTYFVSLPWSYLKMSRGKHTLSPCLLFLFWNEMARLEASEKPLGFEETGRIEIAWYENGSISNQHLLFMLCNFRAKS